jgi:hypothetical protein
VNLHHVTKNGSTGGRTGVLGDDTIPELSSHAERDLYISFEGILM